MDTEFLFLALGLAALFAGFVDSIVGGGGLIQLPALFAAFPNTAPATLFGTNKLAMNFNKKCGMIEEGILREEEYRDGQYVDVHIFGMLKRDWQPEWV